MFELESAYFRQMVEHGLREFPNEACGLVAGKDGRARKVFAMRNADASPATYRLDAKEQLRVFETMDEEGWDLFAIYHTHPHSEAHPSETDRRQALYPDARYLVLSLSDRDNPVLRAFRITEGEVEEEGVSIT